MLTSMSGCQGIEGVGAIESEVGDVVADFDLEFAVGVIGHVEIFN
jgi:hypothetical protein